MMKPNKKKRISFTLIELIIAVVIAGALAGLAMPNYLRARESAVSKEAIANVKLITAAEQVYSMEVGAAYSTNVLSDINTELHLAVSGNNWAYNVIDLGGGNFEVTATRVNMAGKFKDCVYHLDTTMTSGEPIPVDPAKCP